MSFKIGDVVQLKSGGPLMTVTDFHPGGDVFCAWFRLTDAALETASFSRGGLIHATAHNSIGTAVGPWGKPAVEGGS